jgi:hypothetical protein
MPRKKIRLKLSGEKVTLIINGEAAKHALGGLYEQLSTVNCPLSIDKAGFAAIEMFLELFGEEITEKLLRYCEQKPEKAARKFGQIIKNVLYPLAVSQRKFDDRQGVRKYL